MPIKGEQQGYTYKALINGEWQEVTIQESPLELVERFEQDEEWTRVRHGHWERVAEQPYFRKHYHTLCCSECHSEGYAKWKYCPNCGAKMDESTMGQVKPSDGERKKR